MRRGREARRREPRVVRTTPRPCRSERVRESARARDSRNGSPPAPVRTEHLIQVGRLGSDPVLEFDNEHGPVLEDDQIWTPATAAWQFEFEYERKVGRARQTRRKLFS